MTGSAPDADKYSLHPFGVFCYFHIPKENRDGKFRPPSEQGIWVGRDVNTPTGHLVVPIEWDSDSDAWILYPVVTATTVKVYDRVYPLRMRPGKGSSKGLDSFVEAV